MAPPNPHNAFSTGTPHIMRGYLDDDYLYGINILANGDGRVVKWRISTGAQVAQSGLFSTLVSNRLHAPLIVSDGSDSHYTWSLLVDDQDKVHVMGNHHDEGTSETNMRYIVTTNGGGDLSAWSAGDTSQWSGLDNATTHEGTYTYHVFDRMPNGVGLAFMSQSRQGRPTANSSKGRRWLGFTRSAGVWAPIISPGYFAVSDTGDGISATPQYANRVYVSGLHIEPATSVNPGRVHTCFIWRTDDEVESSQQAPCYAYSDDLATWYRADGSVQPMPIRWGAGGGANDNRTDSNGTALVNGAPNPCEIQWGLWTDANGYPGMVIKKITDGTMHLFQWTGSTWTDAAVSNLLAEPRLVTLPGVGDFYRHVSTNRVSYKRKSGSSQSIFLGGPIRTAGVEAAFDWCPVSLREDGKVYSLVGVGDTAYVWSLGSDGARMNHS